jgi:hypothetical protein
MKFTWYYYFLAGFVATIQPSPQKQQTLALTIFIIWITPIGRTFISCYCKRDFINIEKS